METEAPQEEETGTSVRGPAISGLPVKNDVERETRKNSSMMDEKWKDIEEAMRKRIML
jgi:hypothetical protein